jgi:hypothetical protein
MITMNMMTNSIPSLTTMTSPWLLGAQRARRLYLHLL